MYNIYIQSENIICSKFTTESTDGPRGESYSLTKFQKQFEMYLRFVSINFFFCLKIQRKIDTMINEEKKSF